MSDENIWRSIGGPKAFCSFKLRTQTQLFCKHQNNVTNLCEEKSCPLSNSKYATVREKDNKLYLFIKEPERIRTPNKMYEQIELNGDYSVAIGQIDEELKFFNDFLKHKCKQRLTKLTEYLNRKDEKKVEYSVIKRRFAKRELKNAEKTFKRVDVEKELEKELIERMNSGIYGEELKEKLVVKEEEVEVVTKSRLRKKFIAHFEESHDNIMTAEELKNRKKKNLQW